MKCMFPIPMRLIVTKKLLTTLVMLLLNTKEMIQFNFQKRTFLMPKNEAELVQLYQKSILFNVLRDISEVLTKILWFKTLIKLLLFQKIKP